MKVHAMSWQKRPKGVEVKGCTSCRSAWPRTQMLCVVQYIVSSGSHLHCPFCVGSAGAEFCMGSLQALQGLRCCGSAQGVQ